MLKALKEQLMQLSKEDADRFTARIRSQLPDGKGEEAIAQLRSLILLMPNLIFQIRAWANDPRVPGRDKELHGFMLAYLYHPIDFLPESENGFFGYLDDAYFVGAVFNNAMRHMEYGTRQMLPNMKELEGDVPLWLNTAKQVMPEEAKKIDELVQGLLEGKPAAFNQLMSKGQDLERN